ncbi:MAG: cation:dicarboxylate symporter family transporter [Eggerthellaceae bacterium]
MVNRFFSQFNAVMMKMVEFVLKVAPIGVLPDSAHVRNLGLMRWCVSSSGRHVPGLLCSCAWCSCLFAFTRRTRCAFCECCRCWPRSPPAAQRHHPAQHGDAEEDVSAKVANFTIPLGATINGRTAIMQSHRRVAAQAFGMDRRRGVLTVILTATLASIGTAGVRAWSTIMLAMVFSAVGLPAEGIP